MSMACDMCGKNTKALEDLREPFQTDKVKQVCSDCARILNDKLWQIRRVIDGAAKTLLKRFMDNFKQ